MMTSQICLREMRRDDLAAVLALTHMVPEAPWWSEAHVQEITGMDPDRGSPDFRKGWVAVVEDSDDAVKVYGFIVVHGLRLPGEPAVIECEIESIVVHPAKRQRAIGRQLLEATLDWCQQQQVSVLRLEVRNRNMPAIRLYLRNGFSATGVRPGYYESPEDDALLMELRFSATNIESALRDS